MLSEEAIDKLIQPFLDRQAKINMVAIKKIAQRIKEIGTLLPSDIYTLEQLVKSSADIKYITEEIARLTALQVAEIQKIIKIVAQDNYLFAKPFYQANSIKYIPFNQNVPLQRVITAVQRQTLNEYTNLSKAQAFMIRDPNNRQLLRPTPIAQTYQTIVDEAIQATQGGFIDYNTAMQQTLTQLVNSGIQTAVYESEKGRIHTQRLDTAVRRNILDGVRAINQGVQDVTGEQFGADGVELSVHLMPAVDHQFVQGHVYTNEEFQKMQNGMDCYDIQGRHYAGFDRAIGTLNCRHFAFSVITDINIPNYTDEQLQAILNANNQGYTLPNGKHLTLYDCTQQQRRMETNIRKSKEMYMAAKYAGNEDMMKKWESKISKYTKEYKAFSKACGIEAKLYKCTIPDYKK